MAIKTHLGYPKRILRRTISIRLRAVFLFGMILVFGVGFLLTGLEVNAQDTSSPNNCGVQGLSPYETVDSTWDTDCDSYALQSVDENFDTRAEFYYFTIEEGVIVDINLSSEWFNTLVLYDSNWDELEESNEDNYELYSKINTQLEPGIYYLEAVVDEYHNLDVLDSGYTLSLWEFDAQTRIATRSPNHCDVQSLSLYEDG